MSKLRQILPKFTFGVNTVGNYPALCMCLSSVLNGTVLPKRIQVRFEGQLPGFAEFYIEQMAELARLHDVDFVMTVANPKGIRAARDWQLDNCPTEYLWMGDDDALYSPECLFYFVESLMQMERDELPMDNIAYVCGSKPDINNRRGYGNFDTKMHYAKDLKDNAAFNFFWHPRDCHKKYARIKTADTGNMVINIPAIRRHNVKFQLFELSANSGGEDTLFALDCHHKGLLAYFAPSALAYHLEKPKINFNEFAARVEMVLRACEVKGYSKEYVTDLVMPWVAGGK